MKKLAILILCIPFLSGCVVVTTEINQEEATAGFRIRTKGKVVPPQIMQPFYSNINEHQGTATRGR